VSFPNDLRLAARSLRRAPGFAAAVVLVLGLGLGSATAIFCAVDAVLFRKLAVPESDRLVRLYPHPDQGNWSYPAFRDYAEASDAFTGLAAYSSGDSVNLSIDGRQPERVSTSLVSDAFFDVLGVPPAAGRLFGGGSEPVVVLSHAALEKRFGGDPGAVGRAVRLNGHPFTVVGVMPKGFFGPDLDSFPDLWIPVSTWKLALPMFAGEEMLIARGFSWIEVIGRLKPGVPLSGAAAQLDTIAARPRPDLKEADRLSRARVVPVDEALLAEGSSTRRLAWTLLAAAGFVLLLAGSVVAGLLAVRAERRSNEIAIRLAIGASRGDLVRALVAESVLLAALAAALALSVASWVTKLLSATASVEFPIPLAAASPVLALRVLLVTSATALLVGALCGLPAALRASRGNLVPALGANARTVATGPRRGTLGGALATLQVALSVVLLAGAGLLLRTLVATQAVDPGFRVDGALLASIDVSRQGYGPEAGAQLFDELLRRVRALPGVTNAALARVVPVQNGGMRATVAVDGYRSPTGRDENVDFDVATPGFFGALGLPLFEGRDFTARDTSGSPPVAIVNQAFADRFFSGNALGKQLKGVARIHAPVEVVGVVKTAKLRSLREAPQPQVFLPHAQSYLPGMTLVVRTEGSPRALIPVLRSVVGGLDKDIPFVPRTLREHLGVTLSQERLVAGLLAAFGAVALLLATFGLFSVLSFATEIRRREIGIRMALGAEAGDILRLVLTDAARLTVTGILLGTAVALGLSSLLRHLLFRVAPTDPATFLAVAGLLAAAALLATYLPARRATRVDPIRALRAD